MKRLLHPFLALFVAVLLEASAEAAGTLSPAKQFLYVGNLVRLRPLPQAQCDEAAARQLEIPLFGSGTGDSSNGGIESICLMTFLGPDEDVATVYLGGALLSASGNFEMHQAKRISTKKVKALHGGIRTATTYQVLSDKRIRLVLEVEELNDTTGGEQEGGVDVEGKLDVLCGQQRTSYPVIYYRGG